MSDKEQEHRISLEDHSDREPAMSESENKENIAENKENETPQNQGSSWYEKPEDIGNKAGNKIEETLSPIGSRVGPAAQRGGEVLGGVIGSTVDFPFKAGKGWGDQLGVGYGNHEGGPAKQKEAEGEKMKERIGGKEQNAENPLGL